MITSTCPKCDWTQPEPPNSAVTCNTCGHRYRNDEEPVAEPKEDLKINGTVNDREFVRKLWDNANYPVIIEGTIFNKYQAWVRVFREYGTTKGTGSMLCVMSAGYERASNTGSVITTSAYNAMTLLTKDDTIAMKELVLPVIDAIMEEAFGEAT